MDSNSVDKVRASRDGHAFHERWAARRALKLVFPQDGLFAIAIEGLSTNETAKPGEAAEDIADLTLFYGNGDKLETCDSQTTIQFKYKAIPGLETSSYLKKTIQKFADTLSGYEKEFERELVDEKLTFSFVTNTDFSSHLWKAIKSLKAKLIPKDSKTKNQYENLKKWCTEKNIDAQRLLSLIEFQTNSQSLSKQNGKLIRTINSWSPGADHHARARLQGIQKLILEKAGLSGQQNNLIRREEVLDALECDSEEDLFPANTEFIDIGKVVDREALVEVEEKIINSVKPIVIYADGGVGKTVFIQSLASKMEYKFETVLFDCFGGGSYRSEDQSRHLTKIGLLQIVNELASRGLCDPQLPTDGDADTLIKAARNRLVQVADTIKTQSTKLGLLVIIDAADNAQLEANNRNEKSFPRLLLASLSRKPLKGVKLIMTSRPHRMESVIGKSEIETFELTNFSKAETNLFLNSRRENIKPLEFATAFARSGGNARVLDYLVESWQENIAGSDSRTKITVEELIKQRCDKIHHELYINGWSDHEIKQFFTAISLLPPPIPLNEMTIALDWNLSKINSAVSDLAPMLEVVKPGAIFRDEPTETFIRETYALETEAQHKIAARLFANQIKSVYAAEALPRFLIVIEDRERAYELAKSEDFPSSIQSEYGRRRIILRRLNAAFSLAVKARDYDRSLKLTMQLAQIASANTKGDQFIRREPSITVMLGDKDALRRLFQDRSGWRGRRDACLTVAFAFQGELDEAYIHQKRTIGWINWFDTNRKDDDLFNQVRPSVSDFAAVLFLNILKKEYAIADKNIIKWNFPFALSVCEHLITLLGNYEAFTKNDVFSDFVKYTSLKGCQSFALQVSMLGSDRCINVKNKKSIARAASTLVKDVRVDTNVNAYRNRETIHEIINQAAIAALIHNSRQSCTNIIRSVRFERIPQYAYSDRHYLINSWTPIQSACLSAWSAGQELKYYHLIPDNVEITRSLKRVKNRPELVAYLEVLENDRKPKKNRKSKQIEKLFNRNECEDISKSIDLIISLAQPLQYIILSRQEIREADFSAYIYEWKNNLKLDREHGSKSISNVLSKHIGLDFICIYLKHIDSIAEDDANKLVDILSRGQFTIGSKLNVLLLLAKHSKLNNLSGHFAKIISVDIRKEDSIEQRREYYLQLVEALFPVSLLEAREHFRQYLSQLDQMSGDDNDIIYSLLRYSNEQDGGWIKPHLGHRLMNLCQTILYYDPSKFGWTLFGRAAAKSIGIQAIYKLVRWADQDVAELSYGLPQLACFLAKLGHLDAGRAAFILLLCKNEGWHDWKIGDGLRDLFEISKNDESALIFNAVFEKLKFIHPSGGPGYLWESLVKASEVLPKETNGLEINILKNLKKKASNLTNEKYRDEGINRNYSRLKEDKNIESDQLKIDKEFEQIILNCDLKIPHTIDEAIRKVREGHRFSVNGSKSVLERIREKCPYENRGDYISSLVELFELEFDNLVDNLIETVGLWSASSVYISKNKRIFVQNIFKFKGSKLFDLRYNGILQQVKILIDFCGDDQFVLNLVLDTVNREKVKLSGDDWMQLSICLCACSSKKANIEALENLLSGSAAQLGDEIGEGKYTKSLATPVKQSTIIAQITWHLLGNEDTHVRWTAARSIKGLADLNLHADIKALLNCYDFRNINALPSDNGSFSFLNAQQWLLMGLSRACLHHGQKLKYLTAQLLKLADRSDIHVVNKIHIIRCLKNISSVINTQKIWNEVYIPQKGFKLSDTSYRQAEQKSGFYFGYDFNKYQISNFSSLFKISNGEAVDALANEIQKRWPDADSMDYFPGEIRYGYDQTGRKENYCESIQKHALFWAVTSLIKRLPINRQSYDADDYNSWTEFLKKNDVSFEDGSWLSDHKDTLPKEAKQWLIEKNKKKESLITAPNILRRVGLISDNKDAMIPICGSWLSSDGVSVRMVSALVEHKGVIGKCNTFSKLPNQKIWLPRFESDGTADGQFMRESEFEPLLWEPEAYPIGLDNGDQFASRYAAKRPRLGIKLTQKFGLISDEFQKEWFDQNGDLVLRSEVWGQWKPHPDYHRSWNQEEGQILWACPKWLDKSLAQINRRLIFHIDFWRYKSDKNYVEREGLKAVYIALKIPDKECRVWKAHKASKVIY